jgi:hypothetical protein
MSLNVLADYDTVFGMGTLPGEEGYSVRDSGTTDAGDEGLMHIVADKPGTPEWLLAREFIAVNGDSNTDAWEATLVAAKARRKDEVNREAHCKLARYDWYRLRASDGGTAVPAAVTTYRDAIRTESNSAFTAIDALVTVDACRDYAVAWSADPVV